MIKRFYKKSVKNGQKITVLDFGKIRDEKMPFNLIMTERGRQGKTFNAKEHILDRWLKYGERALWCMNSNTQLDNDRPKFLVNNRRIFKDRWKNFEARKDGIWDIAKNEIMIYFASVYSAYQQKGSRDDMVTTVIYDEFNEGLGHIKALQTSHFENLLHTFADPQDRSNKMCVFIFGNTKSLATPLLADLKIFKITEELSIVDNLILIYAPVHNPKELEKYNKNNALFKFSEKVGLSAQSFGNVNLEDNDDGVCSDFPEEMCDSMGFVKVENRFVEFFQVKEIFRGRGLPLLWGKWVLKHDPENTIYLTANDKEHGLTPNNYFSEELAIRIADKSCFFDTVLTKTFILEAVKSIY